MQAICRQLSIWVVAQQKYPALCNEHFSANMWEEEEIFGKKQKLKSNAVPMKISPLEMQNGATENKQRHFVNILRPQHGINAEKPSERNMENEIDETDAVEVRDMIIELNDIVILDSMDTRSNERMEQMKERCQQLESKLRKKDRIIKEMETKHKMYKKKLQLKLNQLRKEIPSSHRCMHCTSNSRNTHHIQIDANVIIIALGRGRRILDNGNDSERPTASLLLLFNIVG